MRRRNLFKSKKNCSKFCRRASLHEHMFKLFFTLLNAKVRVFADHFCSHFNACGFTNHSKSWIQLRSNNVHYHFCFLSPKNCFKSVTVVKTYLKATSAPIFMFSGSCRKKPFFNRKFWGLCTHWFSILRPPNHWIVFFLSLSKPNAVIYPC